jgi:hypothetical protein
MIDIMDNTLEACPCIEHPAAARTKYVPRHVENAEPSRMQKCRDCALLAKLVPASKGEHVDTIEIAIDAIGDSGLDQCDSLCVSRLSQGAK